MRTAPRNKLGTRSVAVVLSGLLMAALAVVASTTLANAQPAGMSMSSAAAVGNVGTTNGWLAGKTVKFVYTKNFFCKEPPSSKARSHCEVGANYNSIPATEFDPLYVVVPVGFTPRRSTLQCPTAGKCVDHPHRIDLTRVFGTGTGTALLPPHSHIVTTNAGNQSEWWNVDVVGVTSPRLWNRIVSHKSYHFIAHQRAIGNKNLTDNIPSNLFLFFKVVG
ncbi:MAG: hypothetical protein ACXVW2_11000 [Nocardioidaceae bacterium]